MLEDEILGICLYINLFYFGLGVYLKWSGIYVVFNIFYDVLLIINNCYGIWMGLVIVFCLYKSLLISVGIVFFMNVL